MLFKIQRRSTVLRSEISTHVRNRSFQSIARREILRVCRDSATLCIRRIPPLQNFSFVYFEHPCYILSVRSRKKGSKRSGTVRAMKLLINGGVDMKYRTLTYRVSVMYS